MSGPIDVVKLMSGDEAPNQSMLLGNTQVFGPSPFGEKVTKFDKYVTSDQASQIGDIRAIYQPNGRAFWNGLVQGAGRVVGDLVAAPGWLAELKDIDDIMRGTEQEWGNALTEFGESIVKKSQQIAPVYARESNAHGFKPSSGEWWGQHMPSIFSTLSLMVPAGAAAKGLSAGARLAGTGRLLSKFGVSQARLMNLESGFEALTAAVTSRHIESMMEAGETFESIRAELEGKVNPSTGVEFTELEIRQLAGKTAANVYNLNWALIATDLFQYGKMMGGIKSIAAKNADETFSLGKAALDAATTMGAEGLEEAYQAISAREAEYATKLDLGMEDGLSTFDERLMEYLADGEVQSAAFMGALGGGLFHAAFKQLDLKKRRQDNYLKANRKIWEAYLNGEQTGKTLSDAEFNAFNTLLMDSAELGNIRQPQTLLQGMLSASDDQLVQMFGTDTPFMQGKQMTPREAVKIRLEQAQKAEEIWNRNAKEYADFGTDYIRLLTQTELKNDELQRRNTNITGKVKEAEAKTDVEHTTLDGEQRRWFNLNKRLQGLKNWIKKAKTKKDRGKAFTEHLDSKIDEAEKLQKEIDESAENIKEDNPKRYEEVKNYTSRDKDDTIAELTEEQIENESDIAEVKEEVADIQDDPAGKVEEIEDEKKAEDKSKRKAYVDEQLAKAEQATTPIDRYKQFELVEKAGEQLGDVTDIYDKLDGVYQKKLKAERESAPRWDPNLSIDENLSARYIDGKKVRAFLFEEDTNALYDTIGLRYPESSFTDTSREFINKYSSDPEVKKAVDEYFAGKTEVKKQTGSGKVERKYSLKSVTNIVDIDSYIDEFLTNQKQPWFVNMHHMVIKNNEVVYNNDNLPVLAKQTKGIDWHYVNDPITLKRGTELTYEVDLDYELEGVSRQTGGWIFDDNNKAINKNQGADNMVIYLVDYSRGSRKVVGDIRSSNSVNDPQLKALREEIYRQVQESEQDTGVFKSTITTRVVQKLPGRFNKIRGAFQKLSEVFKTKPLIIGIATEDAAGIYLEIPNSPLQFRSDKLTLGHAYAMVQGGNGEWYPHRLFTHTVNQVPVVETAVMELLDIMEEANQQYRNGDSQQQEEARKRINQAIEEMQEYVHIDEFDIDYMGNFTYEDDAAEHRLTRAEFDERVGTFMVQIASNSKFEEVVNTGTYNQRIAAEGRLSTDLSPTGQFFHSAKIEVEPYQVAKRNSQVVDDNLDTPRTVGTLTDVPDIDQSELQIPDWIKPIMDRIIKDSEGFSIVWEPHPRFKNKKISFYVNPDIVDESGNPIKFERTTSFTSAEDVPDVPRIRSASKIGTNLDEIARDFFTGKAKKFANWAEYINEFKEDDTEKDKAFEGTHIFKDKATYQNYIRSLVDLYKQFKANGEMVFARDITLHDKKTGLAGTIDILTIDKNGVVRIYDMKAKRKGLSNWMNSYGHKFTDMEKYQRQLSVYRILLWNTYGLKAERLSILPIKVNYTDGRFTTSEAWFIPNNNSWVTMPKSTGQEKSDEYGVDLNILDEVEAGRRNDDRKVSLNAKPAAAPPAVEESEEGRYTVVPKEEYDMFVSSGHVKPERIDSLVEKVKNNETLSPEEAAIFADKEDIINQRLRAEVPKEKNPNSERPEKADVPVVSDPVEEQPITNKDHIIEVKETKENKGNLEKLAASEPALGPLTMSQIETALNNIRDGKSLGRLPRTVQGALRRLYDKWNDIENTTRYQLNKRKSRLGWTPDEEIAWFKKKFPNITLEMVEDLRQIYKNAPENGWAMFQNAALYIKKQGLGQGDIYHEAFHIVFGLFLNEKQKTALYAEAADRYGFANEQLMNDIALAYPHLNEAEHQMLYLEEEMAEEFADFKDSETRASIPQKIYDFFRRLLAIIRHNVLGYSNLNDIFYLSGTPYLRQPVNPVGSEKFLSHEPRYKLPNMSPHMSQVSLTFIRNLFQDKLDAYQYEVSEKEGRLAAMETLDNVDKLKYLSRAFDRPALNMVMGDVLEELVNRMTYYENEGAYSIAENYSNLIESIFKDYRHVVVDEESREQWNKLSDEQKRDPNVRKRFKFEFRVTEYNKKGYKEILAELRHLGLKMDLRTWEVATKPEGAVTQEQLDLFTHSTNDVEDENLFRLDENEKYLEGWMIKVGRYSLKDNLNKKFKSDLERIPTPDLDKPLPKTADGIQRYEQKRGSVYNEKLYEPSSRVYNTLQVNLSETFDIKEMEIKLKRLIAAHPWVQSVYDKIHTDQLFKTQLFTEVAAKGYVEYTYTKQMKSGEVRIFSANRTSITDVILDDWKYGLLEHGYLTRTGEVTDKAVALPDRFSNIVAAIKRDKVMTDAHADDLAAFFFDIGMNITRAQLINIATDTVNASDEIVEGYDNLMNFLSRGKVNVKAYVDILGKKVNPFSDATSESTLLQILAGFLKVHNENYYQSAFRNVENKNMYSHVNANHALRKIAQLKNNTIHGNRTAAQILIEGFMKGKNSFYKNSPMLLDLLTTDGVNSAINKDLQDMLKFHILDGVEQFNDDNGTRYENLSDGQLYATMFNAWWNGGANNRANYTFPILSDAPVLAMMTWKKYDINKKLTGARKGSSELLDAYYNVALQEWNRIQRVTDDIKKFKAGKKVKLINNFHGTYNRKTNKFDTDNANGLKFHFIPVLNKHKKDINNPEIIKPIIDEWLNSKFDENLDLLEEMGLLEVERDATGTIEELTLNARSPFNSFAREDFEDNLRAFVYNDMLMRTQLATLFSGDPAFYKHTEDFYKRNKQIWSPGTHLDITAQYLAEDGEILVDVRRRYNVAYIDDVVTRAPQYEEIKAAVMEAKHLTDEQKEIIIKEYESVSETDGQGFIDLYRYREVMVALGRWNDKYQRAYDHLIVGDDHLVEDDVTFEPIKPFLYSMIKSDGLIHPVQHKYSEFLLLPSMAKDNPGIQDMMRPMGYSFDSAGNATFDKDNRKIDLLLFNSGVKVGEVFHNKLDGEIAKPLTVADISNIPDDAIHSMDNSDYKYQVEVPEHFVDSQNKFGSQIRRLGVSDLEMDEDYYLDGQHMGTGENVLRKYQEALVIDTREGYNQQVANFFEIAEKLSKEGKVEIRYDKDGRELVRWDKLLEVLRNEIYEQNLGDQYLEALQFIEGTEELKLPLYHPLHSKRVEALLNSFFKNNITVHKISGASFVNVSTFGQRRKPKIVFKKDHKGRKVIDYIEAYVPPTSKMFKKNGELISIAELEQAGLDRFIAYRIPTEDKYSMFNIKIIGFTPEHSGGGIILPTEVTTIAGLDFDIDKMYSMFYDFKKEFAWDRFRRFMVEEEGITHIKDGKMLDSIIKSKRESLSERDQTVYDIYHTAKKNDHFYKLVKVESGLSTRPSRNNYKIDLIRSVLQSHKAVEGFLNPGGFDNIKRMSAIVQLLKSGTHSWNVLSKMTYDQIEGALEKYYADKALNISLINTNIEMFRRNMTGAKLIGIFANHNASHAVTQYTNLKYGKSWWAAFDGKSYRELNRTINGDMERISKVLASFLAASVDNAKDPIANFLNISTESATILILLVRLGVPMDTALAFMSQPILVDYIQQLRVSKAKMGDERLASDVKKALIEQARDDAGLSIEGKAPKGTPTLYTDSLFKSLEQSSRISSLGATDKKEYYYQQYNILNAFLRYEKMARGLDDFVQSSRPDAIGAGPTMSHNQILINNVNDQLLKSSRENPMLEGVAEIFSPESKVPMVWAHYEYGIRLPQEALSRFFLWNTKRFTAIVDAMSSVKGAIPLSAREREVVNYNLLTFLASKYPFFSNANKIREQVVLDLNDYKIEFPDNKYKPFLDHIRPRAASEDGMRPNRLEMIGTSGLDKIDIQRIRETWEEMLKDDTEVTIGKRKLVVSDLAKDLVLYTFHTAGFSFTPYSFAHLIPVDFMAYLKEGDMSFNEYLKSLEGMMRNDIVAGISAEEFFIEQFLRNNYKRLGFVVKATDDLVEVGSAVWKNGIVTRWAPKTGRLMHDKAQLPYVRLQIVDSDYLYSWDGSEYQLLEPRGKGNFGLVYDASRRVPEAVFPENRLLEMEATILHTPSDIMLERMRVYEHLTGETVPEEVTPIVPEKQKVKGTRENPHTGRMYMEYKGDQRADVESSNTLDAVLAGERTATTRYGIDGHMDYWNTVKEGDYIYFHDGSSKKPFDNKGVLVRVTKAMHPLRGSGKTPSDWSRLEGWSVEYFHKNVRYRLDDAHQIEFEIPDLSEPAPLAKKEEVIVEEQDPIINEDQSAEDVIVPESEEPKYDALGREIADRVEIIKYKSPRAKKEYGYTVAFRSDGSIIRITDRKGNDVPKMLTRTRTNKKTGEKTTTEVENGVFNDIEAAILGTVTVSQAKKSDKYYLDQIDEQAYDPDTKIISAIISGTFNHALTEESVRKEIGNPSDYKWVVGYTGKDVQSINKWARDLWELYAEVGGFESYTDQDWRNAIIDNVRNTPDPRVLRDSMLQRQRDLAGDFNIDKRIKDDPDISRIDCL